MAIVISGVNNNDKITASDGTIDLLSGVNYTGIITAPSITASNNITAGNLNIGSNIQLGNAGVATATTFVGNLTGNVNATSNLLLQIGGSEKFRVGSSGQLGIAGANYGTSGQVLTSGGSGSAATWSTISGTTINNQSDNRMITCTGTSNTLNAEQYLTYTSQSSLNLTDGNGTSILGGNYLLLKRTTANTNYINAPLNNADLVISADRNLLFHTVHTADYNSTERVRITEAGLVGVGQATPTQMLHVDSSNASDSTATAFFKGRIVRVDGAAASNSPRLNFSLDGTDKAQILLHRTNVGLDIATLAAEPIKFGINSVEKLQITSAGTAFVKADGTEPVNQSEAGHYGGSGYNAGNALGLMVKRAIHVSDADTKGVGAMILSHTRNVACNGTAYNMFTLHNREGTFVGDIYVGFSGNSSGAVRHYKFTCLYNTNNLTSVDFNRRTNNENLTCNISSSGTSHFFQVIPTKSGGGTERVVMTIVGAMCGRNDGAGGDFYTVSYN